MPLSSGAVSSGKYAFRQPRKIGRYVVMMGTRRFRPNGFAWARIGEKRSGESGGSRALGAVA